MSEISEIEIKSMTKEQNYMRGYKDGKSDALDKIIAEVEKAIDAIPITFSRQDADSCLKQDITEIINKYKAESVELNKTYKKVYFIGSGYEVVKQVIVEATDDKSALEEAMKMYHNHKWNFDFCEIIVRRYNNEKVKLQNCW